jgi:hypothetical protein
MVAMNVRLLIFGLLVAAGPVSATGRSYLASVKGITLRSDESISSFTVKTWGVEIKAICHIPADWEITAGRFGPLGRIAGQAGHGATSLRRSDLGQLRGLALIELSGPIYRHNHGSQPVTFQGDAGIDIGRTNRTRTVRLTTDNIQLVRAVACPRNR